MIKFGCECTDNCTVHYDHPNLAPVIKRVLRNGKELDICSRCDLSGDIEIKFYPELSDNAAIFLNYDALGALCILGRLNEPQDIEKTGT